MFGSGICIMGTSAEVDIWLILQGGIRTGILWAKKNLQVFSFHAGMSECYEACGTKIYHVH